MTSTVADDAYAAGIFDGEGCVIIVRDARPRGPVFYLRVTICMTDRVALDMLSTVFGGPVWCSARDGGRRDLYTWAPTGNRAAEFLTSIRPYLRVKAAQADLALAFQSTVQRKGHNSAVQPEVQQRREVYWRELQELKTRVVA